MEFLSQPFYTPPHPAPVDETASVGTEQEVADRAHEQFQKIRRSTTSGRRQSIAIPALKNPGTWRTFGKVEAAVKVWEHGHLIKVTNQKDKKKAKKDLDGLKNRLWTLKAEGTIWVQKSELLFVFYPTTPPTVSAASTPLHESDDVSNAWWNCCRTGLKDHSEKMTEIAPPLELEGETITAVQVPLDHILSIESSTDIPEESLSLKRTQSLSMKRTRSHSEKEKSAKEANTVIELFVGVPLHVQATRESEGVSEDFEGYISFQFSEALMNEETVELLQLLNDRRGKGAAN